MIKLPVHKYDFDGREIHEGNILRSLSTSATYQVLGVSDDKLLVEMLTFRSYLSRRREYPAPDGSLYEPQARDLPVSQIVQSFIYVAQGYTIEGREVK